MIRSLSTLLEKDSKKDTITQTAKAISLLPKKTREVVLQGLEKELFKKENVGKVFVSSAEKLHESQQKEIEKAVKQKYKFDDVVIVEKVQESLIGGMKVRVGDEVYDGTIRTKINKLKNIWPQHKK